MIGVTECQSNTTPSKDVTIEIHPSTPTTPLSHSSFVISKLQSFNANKSTYISISIPQEPEQDTKQTTCTDMLVFTARTAASSARSYLENLSLALDGSYKKNDKAPLNLLTIVDQNNDKIASYTSTPTNEISLKSLLATTQLSSDIAISTSVHLSRKPNITHSELIRRKTHPPPGQAT